MNRYSFDIWTFWEKTSVCDTAVSILSECVLFSYILILHISSATADSRGRRVKGGWRSGMLDRDVRSLNCKCPALKSIYKATRPPDRLNKHMMTWNGMIQFDASSEFHQEPTSDHQHRTLSLTYNLTYRNVWQTYCYPDRASKEKVCVQCRLL